jgi:xylose dehydrogenase (NAD/NADP)
VGHKAAEKGKHVLCEKPLALNTTGCEEMHVAAEAHGVRLMEAFMYRFHPRIEKVLGTLRDGAIGELRLIHSAFTFRLTCPDNIRLQPELGGGALMDVGCYCVNISRTAAGREPVEVQAFARWGASGVDEQLVGTLRFDNGLLAQFDCALTIERREECHLAGTDAYLMLPSAFLPGTADLTILEHRGRREVTTHTIQGVDEYRLMVEHFADCVRNDRPLRYDALEAARTMQVIEALYRSARQDGQPVAL